MGRENSADSLAAAIVNAWNASDKLIQGQQFTISAISGGVKFTQTTAPANSKQLVEPCKEVKITFTPKNAEGKFNFALDEAQQKSLLASTVFKLNSGIVWDGNVLTIGKESYTFKSGKDSKTVAAKGSTLINLSDYEEGDVDLIKAAAQLLSQQDNKAFTIGYDKAKEDEISVYEREDQKVFTGGELSDLAEEMMGYVKNNILVQSAQAMLAQANQVPQGVLQLLG